ncbi:M23 family metallopeptidase [Actinotignum timonense]|uniref:Peptidoglycan DD-metalloendopeptidase family protein n=1 Tax=Actinotignum timonense TaxID=1870995 RepID=A0ABU5GC03_9ACTO|nr:peptidoglycan DD-metalloendopeptidase family protein [Actinotignum timonense]MDK6905936.1 peptidoglycan DD-metalloendopeptidase family protein [Actinotignum timonense]MDY5146236.1 peptidoglycan DD-metalloendopeptidase family protein [Actinotignum timonense]
MSAVHHTSRGGRRAARAHEAPQERVGKRAARAAADVSVEGSRSVASRPAGSRAAVSHAASDSHSVPVSHAAPSSAARRAASRAAGKRAAVTEVPLHAVASTRDQSEITPPTRRGRRAAAVAPLATVSELPARGKRARTAAPASIEAVTAAPAASPQPEATPVSERPVSDLPEPTALPTRELKPQVNAGRGAAFGVVLPSSLTIAACEAAPTGGIGAVGITTDTEGTEVLSESDIDAAVRAGEARGRAQNRERSDRILAGAAAHWVVARSVSPYRNILIGAVACLGMVLPVMSTLQGNAAQAANPAFVAPMAEEFTTPAQLTGEVGAIQRAQARTAAENPRRACPTSAGASGTRAAFDIPTDRLIVKPLPEGSYRLTSPFGTRVDPISGEVSSHAGQDFGAPAGTPIHAIADGVVKHAGEGIQGRSNNLIIIEHTINGEKFSSWYIHMYDDGVFVKAGDKVKAGDVIGAVGSNGYSTGPHLHLEIHAANDELLDPLAFLEERQAQPLEADCK